MSKEPKQKEYFKPETVENKDVFIVEEHHYALKGWARIKSKIDEPVYLLTFDQHSDTEPAFKNSQLSSEEIKTEINAININDENTILNCLKRLQNYEQIDTALQMGIFESVFALSIEERNNNAKQIKELFWEVNDCYNVKTGVEQGTDRRDEILEGPFLDKFLLKINQNLNCDLANCILSKKYILDFDCDVFHKCRALNPDKHQTFYKLIKNSAGITIALESEYVEGFSGEDVDEDDIDNYYELGLTSEWIRDRLLEHIKNALKP